MTTISPRRRTEIFIFNMLTEYSGHVLVRNWSQLNPCCALISAPSPIRGPGTGAWGSYRTAAPLGFEHRAAEQIVERKFAGAARQQQQQDRKPKHVVRPQVGIDEELDDDRHADERQGRKAREQAESDQGGTAQLKAGRHVGGDLRRDDRHLVLFGKQQNGDVGDGVVAVDFGQP